LIIAGEILKLADTILKIAGRFLINVDVILMLTG
jgi:hypothetical protein